MLLTVSKRLEFSASRRLFDPTLSEAENRDRFGDESAARYGTGRNYVAYFVFSGAIDRGTGMLMNISEIKRRANQVIDAGFDHKFLNEDNAAFAEIVPTAENIARQLYLDAEPLFRDSDATLVACHLREANERSATFYAEGRTEANYWFEFSAARQTMSPQLTAAENTELFGAAASRLGHGHNYRVRVTFGADDPRALPAERLVRDSLEAIRLEFDHKNLNAEVAALKDQPITTENIAAVIRAKVDATARVDRVRLHERDDFFAESWSDGRVFLAIRKPFAAAHRLHAPTLSLEQNAELFGKCNNPHGHGHNYLAEATIGGAYDQRSGTLYEFKALESALAESVRPWQDKHLDLEVEEFRETPSTGENIVQALWPKVDARVNGRLERLRLWETANNRFSLRRTPNSLASSQA